MAFTLPDLPYAKDALEPIIDATTMEIHHGKHHNGYVTKVNGAVEGTDLEGKSLEELFSDFSKLPADKRTPIRNAGGGTWNHNLFWEIMCAPGKSQGPQGDLASALDSDLGGLDKFKEDFKAAATGRFGSGWAWLIVKADGKLAITDTKNQDNPLMQGLADFEGENGTPILGIDVWEHAYYLKYQNRRPDYVQAWFDVVNWEQVSKNYEAAKKGQSVLARAG
jgi:Fe-Mn family superoxide dismutase